MRGKVYITGAGCGDKDLITVKAVKVLKECDTVIYDSLINEEILNFAPKNSEKIFPNMLIISIIFFLNY